ncbi:hypothetical protein [Methylobacterium nodulans]|uniref:Uncharacterized protein n=1 Tax=Methylobacterium nodulans (strain LMG 21967 / CNCM I-2342 / ORS 2060) TaxID=460265 RepID=B8IFF8_METNO|nr:hypothetical protein [Methylobacterium nodulans]ACL57693.1 hypothetical protein Mnod_2738 [Methylobacterium nodulans ORS 2060]
MAGGSPKQEAEPAVDMMKEDWKAFLKRDVGWGFGTVTVLLALQAAFFAYDQILNESRIETTVLNVLSRAWLQHRPW